MERNFTLKLVATLDRVRDIIQAAELPPYLEFLKGGYKYELVPDELTVVGRKELFDHGVQFVHPCLSQECMHDLYTLDLPFNIQHSQQMSWYLPRLKES